MNRNGLELPHRMELENPKVSNGNVKKYITIGVCENGFIVQKVLDTRIWVYSDRNELIKGVEEMLGE